MERVFIGSEALAAGRISRHDLRRHCVRLLPDVYASKAIALTIEDRAIATWLWSRRRGVITGLAASALLGALWVDDGIPVDLNFDNNKAPPGVRAHRDLLLPHEVRGVNGLAVTSAARTALDLARSLTVRDAVARLDALARATGVTASEVEDLARQHPHLRGARRIGEPLGLMDPGAESLHESWLRLSFIEGGFPRPRTQIPVPRRDGNYYLDMGWDEPMLAVEFDDESQGDDPVKYREDITRLEYIQSQGWTVIRVVASTPRAEILRRVRLAWPSMAR